MILAECVRCGLCCHHTRTNQKGEDYLGEPCKFLIKLKSGKTLCRVYRNRLDKEIEKGYFCTLRKLTKYDYENCPLNTGKDIITPKGVIKQT